MPELPGPPGERRQPLDFQVGARAEQLDPLRREHREVDLVAPPVGPPAVVVGEAVIARQLPRAEEHACAAPHASGSAASAAIARPTNSGDSETRKFGSFLPPSRQVSSVTPKCSSMDSERRKPGVMARTAMPCGASSLAHASGSSFCDSLDGMGDRVRAAADDVVFRDFHDQAALRRLHRQRGMLGRDDARGESLPEHRVGVLEIRLPEEAVRLQQRIFSRHAVDDDVEAVVGAEDPAEQRRDLALARVIDAHGDRRAAGVLDQRRGLVDGLRPPRMATACR